MKSPLASNVAIILFLMFFTILFCYLFSAAWVNRANDSSFLTSFKPLPAPPPPPHSTTKNYPPLQCTIKTTNQTCPQYNYKQTQPKPDPLSTTCPDYFRWIHEDLKPWKATGVTRQMVEGGRKTAHFRLVILDGKVYVERYKRSIQTRDEFTLWGLLQLVRWYPGKLPDLELMFDCDDKPVIPKNKFMKHISNNPPVLFRYCSDDFGFDIVFPDWSFWGWAEINMNPWRNASRAIKEGNKKINWNDRVPYAYWKGNPSVHPRRQDLLRCNVSNESDWNIRVYDQDWIKQAREGYKESKLEDQCTHRYKIYIEGFAWSVSQKYILACDSMTLLVKPQYHEFFTRGMLPLVHYWPIRDNQMCKSLKFGVEWGNNHTSKARAIGKSGSRFIHEDLKMENVYDYIFHLLNEYAKLLRFKPEIPPNAIELCPEAMACQVEGVWRKLMEESLEKSSKDGAPCTLPPPYDPLGLRNFLEKKANLTREVELWEEKYWTMSNKNTKVYG